MEITLGLTHPFGGLHPRDGLELARRAAEWGYGAAWASEVDGPDAFTQLGALAATTDLELGVAVVPVQTRTAFVLAMTATTLAAMTDGRFLLGVGASSEVLVERFGGQPFDRPLSHVREMVAALRPALAGERTTFQGEYVRIGGYRPPVVPPAPVPLLLGSLNPRSLRMAGELGDGVCFNQVGPRHVDRLLTEVRAGAAAAGRDLDGFRVMTRIFCVETDDRPAAREMIRRTFAPYAATTVYNRFYTWLGYADEAAGVAAAAARRDRDGMAAAYSDTLIDDVFLIGGADAIAEGLAAYAEAGVTDLVLAPLTTSPQELAGTLERIGAAWRRLR